MDYYATLGPACSDVDTLCAMFAEGMTGMRLNLSHVSLRESDGLIRMYRQAAQSCNASPKLMIDLQGPELRVGELEKPLPLAEGANVALGEGGIPVPEILLDALEPGTEILLDDGAILLTVQSRENGLANCRVLRGGVLRARKSIAAQGIRLEPPALTQDDLRNLADAEAYGVTEVLQPFVRGRGDIERLRSELSKNGLSHVRVVAKIENTQGVAMLDEIMAAADEICIARGDLGNAMPLWELPRTQKHIAEACRRADKPFIVVTQMLHSMQEAKVPTRAEVSDIFNAVLDGASTLMLTGETAVGKYPAEAIKYLVKTAEQAVAYRATRGT